MTMQPNRIPERRLHIRITDCVDSTNAALCRLAAEGGVEGEVLIARCQSAGRGRLGRSFYSPQGTGLYCSILLCPTLSAALMPRLTTAAAVAVAEGISAIYGIETQIKWVNDLYCKRKKVCGILVESALVGGSDRLSHAVVGFGINLLPPPKEFPPELAEVAGALFEKEEDLFRAIGTANDFGEKAAFAENSADATDITIEPSDASAFLPPKAIMLVRDVLRRFFAFYDRLEEGIHIPSYRSRCFLKGERVTYLRGGERFPATVLDIDENTNIVLQTESGEVLTFGSGEISLHQGLS